MPLFWGKNKVKSKATRKQPRTLKQILSDALNKEVNKDPILRRELAFKDAGYDDYLKNKDPIEIKKQEVKAKVVDQALKKIDEDPELAERFVEAEIGKILGHRYSKGGEGEFGDYVGGSPLTQALEQLEEIDALRDKMGGKQGVLGGLINAETIGQIIGLVGTIIQSRGGGGVGPGAGPGAEPQTLIVVDVDGRPTRVTEDEYHRLLQQGKIKPVGTLTAPMAPEEVEEGEEEEAGAGISPLVGVVKPEPEPRPEPKPEFPEPKPEPKLPEFIEALDLEQVATALSLSPEDFVNHLEDMKETDNTANLTWSFLSGSNCDIVSSIIEPYKKHSKVGIYVELLLSDEGKQWLEEVIELVKERANA